MVRKSYLPVVQNTHLIGILILILHYLNIKVDFIKEREWILKRCQSLEEARGEIDKLDEQIVN